MKCLEKKIHSVSFPLHTTMFSKYTELFQLKHILRIFWNCFWNIFGIIVYVKRWLFLKNGGYGNNKLTGLLIIAGGSLLLSQEHIKKRREQRKSSIKKER